MALPAIPSPVFALGSENFEPRQNWSATIQRFLNSDLHGIGDAALRVSDSLTLQTRNGDGLASQKLRKLQGDLRRLAKLKDELIIGAKTFEHFAQRRLPENPPSFPRPCAEIYSRGISHLAGFIERDLMAESREAPAEFRNDFNLVAQPTLHKFDQYAKLRERVLALVSEAESQEPLTYQTGHLSGVFENNMARRLRDLMMLHHREPGNPEISRHGVVIAKITEGLLKGDVRDGAQMLVCMKGRSILGVSQFFAPSEFPSFGAPLHAEFSGLKNAYLLLMLVRPSQQGSPVFPMLMNATMIALGVSGADHIVGEVEHTNHRAMKAYSRFGGRIVSEVSLPHCAPNGAETSFLGLSIPMPE